MYKFGLVIKISVRNLNHTENNVHNFLSNHKSKTSLHGKIRLFTATLMLTKVLPENIKSHKLIYVNIDDFRKMQ